MFDELRKSSKLFSVLVTVLMATFIFATLSYAQIADVTTFGEFRNAVQASTTTTINVIGPITATVGEGGLGTQASNDLTINGNNHIVDANGNAGMRVNNKVLISSITMSSFTSTFNGGAIYAASGSTTTIGSGTEFSFNKTYNFGGAIWNRGEITTGKEVVFSSNTALFSGGALYASSGSSITIGTDSTFTSNFANFDGGAIYATSGSTTTISSGVIFSSNSAKSGGAIYAYNGSKMTFEDEVVFSSNTAQVGGAICNDGDVTIGKKVVFSSNTANVAGGAIYTLSGSTTTIGDGVIFSSNSANSGGAIYVFKGSTMTIGDGVIFSSNSANSGGAIYVFKGSTMTIGSGVKFSSNTANVAGGAIYADSGSTMTIGSDSNFSFNVASSSGGAIYNTGAMEISGSTFESNQAENNRGGAIYNAGTMVISDSKFESNEAKQAGAILVGLDTGKLTVKGSTFTHNTATEYGGAIHISGEAEINDSVFSNNSAKWGGAIYSGTKSSFTITNTSFINNKAEEVGALGVFKNATLTNVTFTSNTATSTIDTDPEQGGSGAIFFGSEATAKIDGGIFEYNESGTAGGAIGTRRAAVANNANATLDIKNSRFTGNVAATRGGAIDNYFYNDSANSGSVYVGNTIFDSNEAAQGGAIYNHGELDNGGNGNAASMTVDSATFVRNTATDKGGAIYNAGRMAISDSVFDSNEAAQGGAVFVSSIGYLTVNGSTFTNNTSNSFSGAIHVSGEAEISDSVFSENSAGWAGAIYAGTVSSITITNTKFINNEAESSIGALGVFKNATLKDVTFTGNVAKSTFNLDGSGAIFFGAEANAEIDGGVFEYNESITNAGAIGTREYINRQNDKLIDLSAAKLDIKNSTFVGNKTGGKGGAINNHFYNSNTSNGSVYVGNTIFDSNEAAQGGAIYNHGELDKNGNAASMTIDSVTFSGNIAKDKGGAIYNAGNLNIEDNVKFISNYAKNAGGAIYNAANSTVTFNGSATFEKNMANGTSNDIYSDGELYFLGGTTTMQGGIVGAGTTTINGAVVNFGKNAILEQYNLEISANSELSVNAENLIITSDTISNDGSLNFTAGTATLANNIVGVGTTTLSNANITIDSTDITQYGLNISSTSTLTSNADRLAITSEIVNDGILKFTGGNNNNTINGGGDLVIAGDVTNGNYAISQNSIEITENNSFTTDADYITTANGILNDGNLTFTGGTNTSTITATTGKGELFVTGNVTNTASITQSTMSITGSLESNVNDIKATEQIINHGGLILTGTGTSSNTINGGGYLDIAGDITNALGTTISQSSITINTGNKFTANATDITTTGNGILNDGSLTFTGGTNINTITTNTGGELLVTGDLVNNGSITQSTISIADTGSIKSDIDNITALEQILNDGGLLLTGNGINNNKINGTGDLVTAGIIENAQTISQNSIEITENNSFTTDADYITTANGILNDGNLTFTGGTNTSTITATTGKGELFITGNVTNTASITQSTITITGSLESNVNDIKATEQILNDGALIFTGIGTNTNIIDGFGDLIIEGNIENAPGKTIDQNLINVTAGNSFTTDATDIATINGILNDGSLTFTGGVNTSTITTNTGGELFVTGDVINNDSISITQSTITITGSLESNVNDIKATEQIINHGGLLLTGTGDNNNTINGTGDLVIAGDITNGNNAISQNLIEITEDNSFTTDADYITTANGILNDGNLTFTGGTNTSTITATTGKGNLFVTGDVTNTASISQSTITIAGTGSLNSDVNNIETTEQILNDGDLIFTGTGANTNIIDGFGDLIINGDIENAIGKTIYQNLINVTVGNSFTTDASDITTLTGILNDGSLTFTGGINTSTITTPNNSGDLFVTGDLLNTAAIEQSTINVESNIFENVRGSSITAQILNASTTFRTDALDLNIADIVLGDDANLLLVDDIAADLNANINGNGSLIKEGDGTVTLNGTNEYAGPTTIGNGALRIGSATNISDGADKVIYMDGGTLITTADMSLNSQIVGTVDAGGANKVNIEVETGTTVLTTNSKIYGEGDLVKTGAGVLDLQMLSNNYSGNTVVNSGTLRGTTKNINGLLRGTGGSNLDTFEFYDANSDVVLNEVDTMAYIGTFNKTGSSTMRIINNFQAAYANILAGTFVINNDATMGGSGNIFTVDNDMIVNNALLKGYGDINVGKLIIGNGATFAPGNSTTTFKVTGDLEFTGDGEYDVEFGQFSMDAAGHYNDNTNVTGTATIGADAKITLNNLEGKYYVHETIDLINAGFLLDGYTYQDANVVFNDNDARELRPGYDTRISTRIYTEGNALKIDLVRKVSEYGITKEFYRSHNEQQAATAIDNVSTGNGGDITLPLDVMEHFFYYKDPITGEANIPALKAALNDVAGVIHANSTMLTFTNAKIEHVYDKVQKRSRDLYPCTKFHNKVWAQYYYNTLNVKENENSPEFDASVNGFLVGFDMISAANWTMGITAGYGTSELKQSNDQTIMNDFNFGFYGGYETDSWLFKAMLLGGYEQYQTDRDIRFMNRIANSEYNGFGAALDLEAGYKIALNRSMKHRLTLKPFVGFTGNYINQDGFEEKGAESLNLKVEGYDNMTAQARVGVGVNGTMSKFGWYAKAGVRQLLTEDYNEIETSLLDYQNQTKMKIQSAEMGTLSYGGGLGADYALSDDWTIFANGLVSFADKSNNYYGNIGLTYKFGCVNNVEKTSKEAANLRKALETKEKELNAAKEREKELQNRIQKYEATIVSEEKAQQMKEKTVKTVRLNERPTFMFGSDELTEGGRESLRQLAKELEQYPDAEILIEGHTDSMGSEQINQKISENRASKVATTLKKDFGVQNDISVIGKGKSDPIAPNDTAEGRALNRRVEFIITTK